MAEPKQKRDSSRRSLESRVCDAAGAFHAVRATRSSHNRFCIRRECDVYVPSSA
jgi:hypothetical protein